MLIIGGGIAAYKSLQLIREISRAGANVRVVLTRAAKEFVTPLTVGGLSGDKVYEELFSLTDEAEMGHIQLSRAADLLVVAPATANLMAKMAQGQADDLATTVLLATDKPVLIAPSMNVRMWLHPATQRNLAQLHQDGIASIAPNQGEMACGEFGPGRMAEPLEILSAIEELLLSAKPKPLPDFKPLLDFNGPSAEPRPLAGRHVLITAGPTHEPIDPVRFIANRSSGKQGYALAQAAIAAGANVTLVSGPVNLAVPQGVRLVAVETARDMLAAVEAALPADMAIFAAAVADWRVEHAGAQKLKKSGPAAPSLNLVENPDILAKISHHPSKRPRLVIGFAAETEAVIANAKAKLAKKGCDLIIANDVSASGGVFGGAANSIHIISADTVESWPKLDKAEVAKRLIADFAGRL